MPLRDIDDFHDRMRARPNMPKQPRTINDITRRGTRLFPDVGTTLPQRPQSRPLRAQPEVHRPRQPHALRHAAAATTPVAATASLPVSPPAPAVPATPPRTEPARPKRRRIRITKKRIALFIVVLLLVCGAWFGTKIVSNLQRVFHGNIFNVLTTTKLKGEDTGRVNILLAGNSADDPGHNGANLTDSIMVISLDVKNHSAFMLSVPRDLWVDIPGYGHAKINEAYVDGEDSHFSLSGYPSGGMGLLEDVIQQNLGVKANYYALVNYNALKEGVDAVGGVDFTVQSSDPRGLYDPSKDWFTGGPMVKLTNGIHHLDGQQALDLARARGDAYGAYGFPRSDFDRTQHQRELILALKKKVLSAGTLANPVTLANLFDSVGKNVRTDMTLSEVRRLYDLGKDLKDSNIQSVGLNDVNGTNLLSNYTSPLGQSALIPAAGLDDFDKIQTAVARMMTNNPVVRENASVVILNGTDTAGLAAQAEKTLVGKEVNVAAVGDAQSNSAATTIIDASHGAKPATLALLKKLYGAKVVADNPYAGIYNADIIVVLGADQVPAAPAAATQ